MGSIRTVQLWQGLHSASIAFTGCHPNAWEIQKRLHLSSSDSEIFADHCPCILFHRIIIIPFLPAYLYQTYSDSLDLNKLPVLLFTFCYSLFLLRKHSKVPSQNFSSHCSRSSQESLQERKCQYEPFERSCACHCSLAGGSMHNISKHIWITAFCWD